MKKIYTLLMAGTLLVLSCSKSKDSTDPDPDPDPEPTVSEEAKKLQQDVLGKWSFTGVTIARTRSLAPDNRSNHPGSFFPSIRKEKASLQFTTDGETGTNGAEKTGFIEFITDSTYILYDAEGNVFTGKFEAKSGDSISLGTFGSLGGIKVNADQMDFRLIYSSGTKTITITGNKAPVVAVDNRTTLLCRNWYLSMDEAGDEVFEPGTLDSLGFTVSPSGTYLVQIFNNGVLMQADMANWKWHSTKSDRFIYYYDEEIPDNEDDNDVVIRENTTSVLKFSEFRDDDGDLIEEEYRYTLYPAK